jgi:hypothetical protein
VATKLNIESNEKREQEISQQDPSISLALEEIIIQAIINLGGRLRLDKFAYSAKIKYQGDSKLH